MSKIENLDKNFKPQEVDENGLIFRNCLDEPFTLYGFSSPNESGVFSRLPISFTESDGVSEFVQRLILHTSGGRVRFRTNSKRIAIHAELRDTLVMYHMPATGSHGFDLYASPANSPGDFTFKGVLTPKSFKSGETLSEASFELDDNSLREIIINFPLYNGVKSLYIGLEENCVLEKATPYSIEKPIVCYGSSVSQGGCASRPGTNYLPLLSRWLDADFINLGFSGADKGEEAIAHHIATLDMSVFIYAYGYNAPSVEHYENTYYPFYEIVRAKNPDLPIIMMSPPLCPQIKSKKMLDVQTKRKEVVINAFEKAKKRGDNVYFIDGFKLLENPESTVDSIHPTDLGFYEMATKIYPLLREILK